MLWRHTEIVLVVWQQGKYGDFKKKIMIRCSPQYERIYSYL